MVFGNPQKEEFLLNEEAVCAGEPGNNVPKNVYGKIKQVTIKSSLGGNCRLR